MYCKRILILQQTDGRFAQYKKDLCGMVKLANVGKQTTVTVFVANVDTATKGEWWLLLDFASGKTFCQKLPTFNNFVFSFEQQNLMQVGCLLVKREQKAFEVARAWVGQKEICNRLAGQMQNLTEECSPYEKFVASTQNFYPQVTVDVDDLKQKAQQRYRIVTEYSKAFDKFYASGGVCNYYHTVKEQIAKVFVQFPPYYPLINKYKGSFFVRVDFPSSDKYFVLGVLQQNNVIKYICYGLPAEKQTVADKDFVFVEGDPTSFYMLFQDADSGQITTLKGV